MRSAIFSILCAIIVALIACSEDSQTKSTAPAIVTVHDTVWDTVRETVLVVDSVWIDTVYLVDTLKTTDSLLAPTKLHAYNMALKMASTLGPLPVYVMAFDSSFVDAKDNHVFEIVTRCMAKYTHNANDEIRDSIHAMIRWTGGDVYSPNSWEQVGNGVQRYAKCTAPIPCNY
jgi:hypothetical protein